MKLDAHVGTLDTKSRHVQLVDGTRYSYDALLLATGAAPMRLEVPGGDLPHVHYSAVVTRHPSSGALRRVECPPVARIFRLKKCQKGG